ncbi:MAG: FAD:protein FMN transferase [Opitutaceae bacterium]
MTNRGQTNTDRPLRMATTPRAGVTRIDFKAMGTNCMIQFVAGSEAQARSFGQAVVDWVGRFEARYSRFREDSLISRINAAAGRGWVTIDEETAALLQLCDQLYLTTGGVFDPTALPIIRLWYRSLGQPEPEIPSDEAVAAAMSRVGWLRVQREADRIFLPEPGMAIDFGGFGKEYAVDQVAGIAEAHGLSDVLVDFGHDVRVAGAPPGLPCWHIGLEDPFRPGQCWSSLGITGRGIATSGDYIRVFVRDGKRYGHIIDPRTGYPVSNGVRSVTVVSDSCLQSGILSTTAFILGPVEGKAHIESTLGADGCLISEKETDETRGFFQYVVPTG